MNAKNVFLFIVAVAAIVFVNSCSKEKSNDKYFDKVTCNETDDTLNYYNGKIKDILDANCASGGCHDASSHKAGKNYADYSNSKNGFAEEGLCTIYQDSGCEPMPRGASKLSDADIHDLTCWVKNGYPQ